MERPRPSYFTTELILVANEPARGPQDCTSFGVISAPFIDRIKVSFDQGGYGELPVGFSLSTPEPTPVYFLSEVNQTITIALAINCELKDTRSGNIDANGNLLVQSGNSAKATFMARAVSSAPAAPTLLLGIYGGTKVARLRKISGNAYFGPQEVTLARFTGAPAASGSIGAMESGDVSVYTLSSNQVAGWVITDTITNFLVGGDSGIYFNDVNQFAKMPTCKAGEGIGFFDVIGSGLQDFDCRMIWTEE